MGHKENVIAYIESSVKNSGREDLFRAPLVGFSSAQDPRYRMIKTLAGEQHVYPEEILPQVKTVISFFIPFTKLVVEKNRQGQWPAKEYALGYIHLNRLINQISEGLIEYFKAQGIASEMVRATHTYDAVSLKASWSHRSAAGIAGLGRFGVNRMLITEKGCAGRFGTVFTACAIEPLQNDAAERCRFHLDGSCRYCITSCPTGALTERELDRHACNNHLLKVDASFPELETCDVCGKCLMGPCAYVE